MQAAGVFANNPEAEAWHFNDSMLAGVRKLMPEDDPHADALDREAHQVRPLQLSNTGATCLAHLAISVLAQVAGSVCGQHRSASTWMCRGSRHVGQSI